MLLRPTSASAPAETVFSGGGADGACTRVLFVDDEPAVLDVVKRMMRSMGPSWQAAFAADAEEGLAVMAGDGFDVVVSDMRMPRMNGAQFLNQVMRRHPRAVRLIMSGFADMETVLKCVGAVHQYLNKPFSPALLRATLERIRGLNQRMGSGEMRTLAARLSTLPSMPSIYLEMVEALESTSTSVQQIADIVARDPALAAKTLQVVNSAFFGFGREVQGISEAIQLLGVGMLRSLALAVPLFSAFDPAKCRALALDQVWTHSVETGLLAKRIVIQETQDAQRGEETFAAGLLHDIGKLVLADNLPGEYARILEQSKRESRFLHEVEGEVLHASHAQVGGYLLGLWGLPAPLVEAVAFHHSPGQGADTSISALTAVHAADVLRHEKELEHRVAGQTRLDPVYMSRLGLAERVAVWRRELLDSQQG